jgi:hypothetical protein
MKLLLRAKCRPSIDRSAAAAPRGGIGFGAGLDCGGSLGGQGGANDSLSIERRTGGEKVSKFLRIFGEAMGRDGALGYEDKIHRYLF